MISSAPAPLQKPRPPSGSLGRGLLRALRPRQWPKNGIIFLALLFTVNQYWTPGNAPLTGALFIRVTAAFVFFCLLSSAEYLFNDVLDAPQDRLHPTKRFRPIAAGIVSPTTALALAGVLGTVSLVGCYLVAPTLAMVAAVYAAITMGYSLGLKHFVIIDVFIIALGFVLRAGAGAVAIGVPISPWLYMCTILGALFLALAKRRNELTLLQADAASHRRNLDEYTPELVDQMINVVTPSTVIAYSLYTFTAETLPGNHAMMVTIPFVLYGVFRYLYLVHSRNMGGSPEEVLLTDRPLIVSVLLWILVSGLVLITYRGA